MTFVEKITKKLDNYLKKEDNVVSIALAKAESVTGISRLYLANSLIVVFTAYMVFGQFAQLICNLIGFVYPAYASLVALDSPQDTEDRHKQIQHLLRYWVVFAFVSVGDFFSGYLFRIIPFYWLAKMVFLVWCLIPIPNNGSDMLYSKIILPVFRQVQPLIDNYLAELISQFNHQNQE